jgi:GNAT superfamily N-acetyltransferase
MPWSTRPLDLTRDADEICALWDRAVPTWPIRRERLLAATTDGHVAEDGGRLIGAVAIHPTAGIAYLIVAPEIRRRGLGSQLHDIAIRTLKDAGIGRAILGYGGVSAYVWPGIPRDLPDAEAFFAKHGWLPIGVSADLSQDLSGYERPAGALERAAAEGVTFKLGRTEDAADLLAYEELEHPNWVPYFRDHLGSDPSTILLGRDREGRVVTSLLMEVPPRYNCHWSALLGDAAAEIGCVGVAASLNGKGIGTALMALATEQVRDAGVRVAYLSWTVRWSFYARLGYRVWREYQMAERHL